jgi:flagellar basal-body rod modification protein FlgD
VSIDASSTLNQLQNNTNLVNYQNSKTNLGTGKLDRDGFIRLILAQLQFQDPTNPQDNTQMLSQQLQLQQADQMNDMTNATKFSSAGSMVGKVATLPDAKWDFNNNVSGQADWDTTTNGPKTVTGTIESVQFDSAHGKALVKINGNYYDSDNIKTLGLSNSGSTGTGSTSQTSSPFLGKQATLVDKPWNFNTNSASYPVDSVTHQPIIQNITGTITDVKNDAQGKVFVKINGNYYDGSTMKVLS